MAVERRSAAEDQPVMAQRHRADLHTLLARFSTFCIAQGRSFVAAAGRWFKAMYPIRVQPAGVVGGDEVGDNALAPSTERHLQFLERQRNSKLPLSIGAVIATAPVEWSSLFTAKHSLSLLQAC